MRAASGSQARGPNYTCESMPRWYTPARSHVPHRRWRRRVLSWPRKRRRKWRKWAGSGERWASHITNQTAATSRTCRQERAGWKEGHRRGWIAGPGRSALPSHGSKHRTGVKVVHRCTFSAAHHPCGLEASGFSRAVAVAQHGPHRRHAGGAAEHIGHAHEQRPMLRHGDASHVQEGVGQQRAPGRSAGTGGEVERLGGLRGRGVRARWVTMLGVGGWMGRVRSARHRPCHFTLQHPQSQQRC